MKALIDLTTALSPGFDVSTEDPAIVKNTLAGEHLERACTHVTR